MKKHIIYGLCDPESKEIRYIGYTSFPDRRYREHLRPFNLKTEHTHKNHWIKSLLSRGVKPEMIEIKEYSTADELPQAEIETIAYFKSIGANLTNSTDGGDGVTMTDEIIAKISKANVGRNAGKPAHNRIFTIEQEKEICQLYKDNKHSLPNLTEIFGCSKSTIANILARHNVFRAGNKMSKQQEIRICSLYVDETYPASKISDIVGCSKSSVIRVLERNNIERRPCWYEVTPETRKKMSDAKIGKPSWSKGKKASEEARKNMSIAQTKRFERERNNK